MVRELAQAMLPATTPDIEEAPTVLALTLWGEARGESLLAQRGVAQVVANRVEHPRWWGSTVASVCLRKRQFSCWDLEDPNRKKLAAPVAHDGWGPWERACCVALETMMGSLVRDPALKQATHYHSFEESKAPKAWGDSAVLLKKVGRLWFFSVEPI